jgi:hypothetical protein
MKNHNFKLLSIVLVLFLAYDILSSAYLYYHLNIDGDITKIVTPILWYKDVLHDPFGIKAVTQHVEYGGAGRFMAHVSPLLWFKCVFNFIYSVIKNPIVSIYICSSLFVTIIHLSLLFIMNRFVNANLKFNFNHFLVLLCLTSSFIQYNRFYDSFGLIDRSISYVFFYIFPILLLAFYYSIFYIKYQLGNFRINIFTHVLLILLSIFLAFSGPLIQPIVFIVSMLCLFAYLFFKEDKKFKRFIQHKNILFHFIFMLAICLYAFYVARFNSEKNFEVSLLERYILLVKGIIHICTLNVSILIVLMFLSINLYFVNKLDNNNKFKIQLFWIVLFIVAYLSLLPLGGYRPYRPYILRYDTLIPVTLLIVYLVVYSTILILNQSPSLYFSKYYIIVPLLFIAFMTIADKKIATKENACQHSSLYALNKNKKDTVLYISRECNLGTWQVSDLDDPYTQEMLTTLFKKWHVIEPFQVIK